jgi:imidazolonepropionase-like amidohydrolase
VLVVNGDPLVDIEAVANGAQRIEYVLQNGKIVKHAQPK